ncbi:MAG: DUF2530 domain-containing protein [Ornithinibacter sp.]
MSEPETPQTPAPAPAPAPAQTVGETGATTPFGPSAPVSSVTLSATSIAVVGTALWVLALVVTLIVPALHSGERSWWPWACVTGIGLGIFAFTYVRRGRGNAVGA